MEKEGNKKGKKVTPLNTPSLLQLWSKPNKNSADIVSNVVQNLTSSESNNIDDSKTFNGISKVPSEQNGKSDFQKERMNRKEIDKNDLGNVLYPSLAEGNRPVDFNSLPSVSSMRIRDKVVVSDSGEDQINSKKGLRNRLPSGLTKGLPSATNDERKTSNAIPGDVCESNSNEAITKGDNSSGNVIDVSGPTADQIEFEEAMSVLANEMSDSEQVVSEKHKHFCSNVQGICMSNSCGHQNGESSSVIKKSSAEEESKSPYPTPQQPSDDHLVPLMGIEKGIPLGNYPLICFDLETTGLSLDDEIVQISACAIIDGKRQEFNQYVLPIRRMAFGASKVTGIRIRRGCLYQNRAKVQTCSILQALNKLLHWLKTFPKSILVAHNAVFDSRMLLKSCVQHNLVEFGLKKAVFGFIDTLPATKELYPGRKTYQLESLVKDVLKASFKAHDAREDTRALLNLIMDKSVDQRVLFKHSFTVQFAEENYRLLAEKKKNMKSLRDLVDASALSKGMAEKMAGSGLTRKDLDLVVKEKGFDGIREVFKADTNGKPRITNRTAIIQNLFDHLTETIQDS